MTTLRFRALPALTFALFSLAACGDDDPVRPDDDLTDSEIVALVEALMTSAMDPSLPDDGAVAPAATAVISFPIDDTAPCALGGSIRLQGAVTVTVDDTEESGTYEHEIDQVHRNCVVQADGLAEPFRFVGAPSIVSTVRAEIVAGAVTEFEGAESGTVRWTLGDRQGRCEVDLAYTISPTLPADPSYQVTGTVCARPVDRLVTM